ncbi:MAG TPA: 5-formyltetrahydrofolate cyclo-ligase, partial [Candidatus Saccharimonadales bacterium]
GAPPDKFDVILVPMLGFDPATLHRIGYGGGYYDKFLAGQPQAKKIGVCFEQAKVKNFTPESYDVPLNVIVTEQAIYLS